MILAAADPTAWQPLVDRLGVELPKLLEQLLSPWMLPQLLIVPACYYAALTLTPRLLPRIEARLATLPIPTWMRRLIDLPLRQVKWLLFVAMLWLVVALMRALTWPSRSYVVLLVASLATAWATINIASPLIRNQSLSKAFAAIAWGFAALYILGVLGEAQQILDSIGFKLGDVRITVLSLLKVAIFLGVTLWLASLSSRLIDGRMHAALDLSPTVEVLFSKVVRAALFVAAVAISLSAIGIELTALTVLSGALGLGIGFGLQKVASNLMSGIIILLDKSVKPGDVIQRGDTFGWITALKARYVSVATRDGVEYLIPNEDFITGQVINWSYTDRKVRLEVLFAVATGADPHEVCRIACSALASVQRVLVDPAPACHVAAFGSAAIDFSIRFWIEDPENGITGVQGETMLALWDTCKSHGMTLVSAKAV